MELWHYLLLLIVGLVAGFINVIAGGGSLLTMPVMIFLGMEPALANGTNRVALVAQNATAIATFRKRGFADFEKSLGLALCTLPGAVVGAWAAIVIDPIWFKRLLAVVMVGVLLSMLVKREKKKEDDGTDKPEEPSRARSLLAHLAMFGVGFYGGFIQAGVGFILMAVLHHLLRLDLVRVNMHKVFIVGLYMLPSLLVFALQGQVYWIAGCSLAVGNALGGWAGTRAQISRGQKLIKVVFALAVLAMVVRLLWNQAS